MGLTGVALVLGAVPALLVVAPVIDLLNAFRDASPVVVVARFVALSALVVLVLPVTAVAQGRYDVARARLVDRRPLAPVVESSAWRVRWRQRWTEPASWLRVLHLLLLWIVVGPLVLGLVVIALGGAVLTLAPVLVALGTTVSGGPLRVTTVPASAALTPFGIVLLVLTPYLCAGLATAQVAVARRLLSDPSEELARDLVELRTSRERLVHDFDAERRRIERDLHDGAQQRLVSLTMRLGLVRREAEGELGEGHPVTREVADAHEQAKGLMGELRGFIRGIHPQVLSDVGLDAALDQLTSTMPLPVDVQVEGDRQPTHVESTLYFSITEALTNVTKHSGATHASVQVRPTDHGIVADIADDGHGGADPGSGTGLRGIADRVAVVDGSMAISSPEGGPTLVRITVPRPERMGP